MSKKLTSLKKQDVTAVVLAAGLGKRMGSHLAKSLHPVAGKPMLVRILQILKKSGVGDIRVVIHPDHKSLIQPIVEAFKAKVYLQDVSRKGTAVAALGASIDTCKKFVLILNGDHPLIMLEDVEKLIECFNEQVADVCVGFFQTDTPGEYGRVVRRNNQIVALVEKKALTPELEKVKEINTGMYLIKSDVLGKCLFQIMNTAPRSTLNGEYGLTDIISLCSKAGKKVAGVAVSEDSAFGVNSQKMLALATKKLFMRKLNHLMRQGVIIIDPLTTYIEEDVHIGMGSVIYPGVYLKGKTGIGPFCAIEPHCFIADSVIHHSVLVRAGSYLEQTVVGSKTVIGPYARLRIGTKIGEQCKVGNFVEMKKTHFGDRSKASHLSYLGDAEIGTDVNIGCSTVTCNLHTSGKKHPTKIGDGAFIGSGTQLVAPVDIGEGSVTGAGSVITKDVPNESVALSRVPQVVRSKKK